MSKAYSRCPKSVTEHSATILKKRMPAHHKLGVTVDHLYVSKEGDGPALTSGGYAFAGIIRKTSTKERAAGRADAEMVLDLAVWQNLTELQREALLHHELYHLEIKLDRNGKPKVDDIGRPALKIRKHDHQFGWFDEIARVHGVNSFEVRQAMQLLKAPTGQLYFTFPDIELPNPVLNEETLAKAAASKITPFTSGGERQDVSIKLNRKMIFDTADLSAQLTEAVAVLKKSGKATPSRIQRGLRVGYNRACEIMAELERLGVVGPDTGSAQREILVDLDTVQIPAAVEALVQPAGVR